MRRVGKTLRLLDLLGAALWSLCFVGAVQAEVEVFTGEGRLNAAAAMAVTAVPNVRITSPRALAAFSQEAATPSPCDTAVVGGTVSLCGTAAGTGFQSYRLFYAASWVP